MKFQPVIKWSGSKRSQSEEIVKRFPKKISTYFEPFVGGASVLRQLLENNYKVDRYVCSDINKDLINLWNEIISDPDKLSEKYLRFWQELNCDENIERKKEYYNKVRARCNVYHDPSDFLFISRTTVNGLIRYNRNGQLNNSFHLTRDGIKPETLSKILQDWSKILNEKEVVFKHCSYFDIESSVGDLIYLDPPYFATKGMYYGTINYLDFWDWCKKQEGSLSLSFDGRTNIQEYTQNIPEDIFIRHEYLLSGNSSFRRVIGNSKDTIVSESFYLNY